MRILIATDTFFPETNGVAAVVYRSARGLSASGHEVLVVAPKKRGREELRRTEAFELLEIPAIGLPAYPDLSYALPFSGAGGAITRWRPDIIHSHTPFSVGRLAARVARRLGVPLVGTHHTFFDHYLKHVKLDYPWGQRFSWRFVVSYYNRCTHVVSPSRALVLGMRRHGLTSDISHLPNPADIARFVPADDAKRTGLKKKFGIPGPALVYMGRVSYEKSITYLLGAYAIARKAVPNLTLSVVGDGPEREKLQAECRRRGIADGVRFTGFLYGADLVAMLQAHDVFVTASESENMPISVIEGLATGLPVIGVDALGIPEIVHDEESGIIVPPKDVYALARAMVRLCTDERTRARMAKAARASVADLSDDMITARLEKIYRSAMPAQGTIAPDGEV
jgi:glycosyltransferase involved in cell wall biosynthesis